MAANQANLGNFDALTIQSLYIAIAQKVCIEEYGIGALSNATERFFNATLNRWMCPAFFDGIMCWPNTPANRTAEQQCPTYVIGIDKEKENASRFCTSSGQWYISEHNHAYWTNYTQCYGSNKALVRMNISMDDEPDLTGSLIAKYIWSIKTLSRVGYSISLITLIVAFIVMFSIKKLHCPRNKLHMHLFASFIFRAFISLLKDALFIQGIGLASDMKYRNGSLYFYEDTENNNWSCKLLTSLWEFFITANYSWILMEGVYLHNLIFRALFSDTDSNLRNYIIFGWGTPALVIIPWAITRATTEDTFCWTTHDDEKMTFLILSIPVIISILVNFVLFIKITAMIMKKLRSSLNAEAQRYKKWARSTLVLVPLFGVHYAVLLGMSFCMGRNQTVELIWLFCDQLFASSQVI
ncbi:secretin receptor-like [Agrilus planipennis]|uniref:Secretin receptor-like n=1 Tax=Agrilus planipennis TaxID=224129 RepID=A0A1W4XN78_AGRPL|nr:secretin receptor-like [Agrilus planipennis]